VLKEEVKVVFKKENLMRAGPSRKADLDRVRWDDYRFFMDAVRTDGS